MAKDNHQRYCCCRAPDPQKGYCQNCGEKTSRAHMQYETLRTQFEKERALRGPLEILAEERRKAISFALDDACLYGTGFYRIHPNGHVEYIPFEQMHIERGPVAAPAHGEPGALEQGDAL